MGDPIAHSRSPFIHARFAGQTGQSLTYTAIRVEPGAFYEAVSVFRARGGLGLNITVPFKQQAWSLADSRTQRAERAGAVNTMWFDDARVHGDNTDGIGLVRDLECNLGLALAGLRILILGAGGAARGVLDPLLAAGPELIVIANRTAQRAETLCESFSPLGPVRAIAFEALPAHSFELVINATSASLAGEVPPVDPRVLRAGAFCYDMMYGARPTVFVRWGEAAGAARSTDGIGMLVEQAAESFQRWRGMRPDTAPVIAQLREAFEEEAAG